MDHDQQFLSFIHKNAAMGGERHPPGAVPAPEPGHGPGPEQPAPGIPDHRRPVTGLCPEAWCPAPYPGLAVRAMSGAMLKARTAADHTTSKLAQLMIQGSTMGTVEMTRRIHQYTGKADPELLALGSRLLHTEEQNIQQMKRFL